MCYTFLIANSVPSLSRHLELSYLLTEPPLRLLLEPLLVLTEPPPYPLERLTLLDEERTVLVLPDLTELLLLLVLTAEELLLLLERLTDGLLLRVAPVPTLRVVVVVPVVRTVLPLAERTGVATFGCCL